METNPISLVRVWNMAFGVEMNVPAERHKEVLPLLARLVSEEAKEADDEFNYYYYGQEPHLNELAKELGDTIWVCIYSMLVLGIPVDRVMRAIYNSNMSKLGPDGKVIRDEGGKIQKGPNYVPANLDFLKDDNE